MRICVYCASSACCHPAYYDDARRLGTHLASGGHEIVYGGGAVGSMGALANAALSAGGRVIGVIPSFMEELEWGHTGLHELQIVEDMRVRKHRMLSESAAAVALPGGSGTLEELFETLTLKRLGLYPNPIILVNTNGFYDAFATLMEQCIQERFMAPVHQRLWTIIDTPEQTLEAIAETPPWTEPPS